MARLYREAPLNSIWEGSGNVICLDVLRAMHREPESLATFLGEIDLARGGNRHLDRALDELRQAVTEEPEEEARARWLTERMALALQGALLVRHAPEAVADAFCSSRLATSSSRGYGTLPGGTEFGALIERARVEAS
jgi:putative acyl-CoA dehydrogenase